MTSLGLIAGGNGWWGPREALAGEPPSTKRRWTLRTRGCERRLRFIETRCTSALAWFAYAIRVGAHLTSSVAAERYAHSTRPVTSRRAADTERAPRGPRPHEPVAEAYGRGTDDVPRAPRDEDLARDRLLAAFAHELRSPLGVTLNWAELLLIDDQRLDEKLRRGLRAIERSARLQQRLVEDVLDAARIGFGSMRVERARLELSRLCTLAITAFEPKAHAAGIALSAVVEAWQYVDADEVRVQQLLYNLLDNALKFTPRGGHVSLTLSRLDGAVELVVADDGRGIAPDLLPRIFERYTQGKRDGARSSGLGLGLAIAKRISELHGGTLTVHSAGVGCGATFTWRIPSVPPPGG